MESFCLRTVGGYVDFDHEPNASETAEAATMLLADIANDLRGCFVVRGVKFGAISMDESFIKNTYGSGPLCANVKKPEDTIWHWSVYLKASLYCKGPVEHDITDGQTPDPIAINGKILPFKKKD